MIIKESPWTLEKEMKNKKTKNIFKEMLLEELQLSKSLEFFSEKESKRCSKKRKKRKGGLRIYLKTKKLIL